MAPNGPRYTRSAGEGNDAALLDDKRHGVAHVDSSFADCPVEHTRQSGVHSSGHAGLFIADSLVALDLGRGGIDRTPSHVRATAGAAMKRANTHHHVRRVRDEAKVPRMCVLRSSANPPSERQDLVKNPASRRMARMQSVRIGLIACALSVTLLSYQTPPTKP